jgi:hypothetical protein
MERPTRTVAELESLLALRDAEIALLRQRVHAHESVRRIADALVKDDKEIHGDLRTDSTKLRLRS